jgi:hypothetical protein
MAGAVIRITKGKMFQATDAVLATPPPGKTLAEWYQQLRQDLIDGQDPMSALATEVGVIAGATEVAHADQEVFGEHHGAFWPGIPDKEKIIREGFITAYDLALSQQPTRPIVTFWIIVSDIDVFEVVVSSNPSQVTWFWVTSEPPGWGGCQGAVEENLWLVASPTRISHVLQRYANSGRFDPRKAGANEAPPRAVPEVEVVRLRGD